MRFDRFAAFLLVFVLLLGCCAFAEEEGGFPVLNEDGYLDEGEFVYSDKEQGVWRYVSETLKVEIFRRTQQSPAQIWYEAEIWCDESEGGFRLIPFTPEKPLNNATWPYKIARKYRTVFAINTDYANNRYAQKTRMGIIIRSGKVYSDKTWKKGAKKFPNLDVLALYPDGMMEVYDSNEKKAAELLEMGVESTLAFGPVLIRDGELNATALKKYGTSKAPRTAIGMVENGHYFAMMLEGRHNGAKGAGISFLAEKLLEKGCALGFNLDGGQTSTILFMGEQICMIGGNTGTNASARKSSEILGIGTSELVTPYE